MAVLDASSLAGQRAGFTLTHHCQLRVPGHLMPRAFECHGE